jgi:hypothetical protein
MKLAYFMHFYGQFTLFYRLYRVISIRYKILQYVNINVLTIFKTDLGCHSHQHGC